jgi:hypothetical protein
MPNPSAFLTLCKAWLGRVCSISVKVWRCELGCPIGKPIRSLVGIMPPPSLLLFYSGVDSLSVLCPTSRVPHRNMDLVSMSGGTPYRIDREGRDGYHFRRWGGSFQWNDVVDVNSDHTPARAWLLGLYTDKIHNWGRLAQWGRIGRRLCCFDARSLPKKLVNLRGKTRYGGAQLECPEISKAT